MSKMIVTYNWDHFCTVSFPAPSCACCSHGTLVSIDLSDVCCKIDHARHCAMDQKCDQFELDLQGLIRIDIGKDD